MNSMKDYRFDAAHRRPLRALALPIAVLLLICASVDVASEASSDRVVAVGDIHGDFDAFTGILREAGLLDEGGRWAGGTTTLVQLGDFTGRGPDVRRVMDLLMALEEQAPASGGRVVVLLGNHEMLNLLGDLRYVAAEDFADFADDRSERRRRDAYRAYSDTLRRRGLQPLSEAEWMGAHPPGFVEHRDAFDRRGRYGRWLREKAVLFEHNGTLFVHGGISPRISAIAGSVDAVNQRVRRELRVFDRATDYLIRRRVAQRFFTLPEMLAAGEERFAAMQSTRGLSDDFSPTDRRIAEALRDFLGLGGWFGMHPEGPLWFRGLANWPEERAPEVDEVLRKFRALRFVVGHGVQGSGRIQSRFGDRVFLIDTGMLSSYYTGGRASALEIEGGRFTAIYRDGRRVLGTKAAEEVLPAGPRE